MNTNQIVILILTNLIMVAGGYYLGVWREREDTIKIMREALDRHLLSRKYPKKKEAKNAKHASRV